jgi:small-conductance mechanosensitive channel
MFGKQWSNFTDASSKFFSFKLYGNSVTDWLIAAIFVLLLFKTISYFKLWITTKIRNKVGYNSTGILDTVADTLEDTYSLFILFASIFFAVSITNFSVTTQQYCKSIFLIGLVVQAGVWASRFFRVCLVNIIFGGKKDSSLTSTVSIVSAIGQFAIWIVVGLLILDNFGIDITALVAGLGIGGIAVALAVQKVLEDLLSSVAIVLDKPFEIGDFIIVGELMGSVEKIGIKTTRVRSIGGEQLIFPNTDLLGSRIRNFKRMYERRVVFSLGVIYQTPLEKLKLIPTIIREAIQHHDSTRFDRAHFSKYGSSSLDFEIVFYILSSDYTMYMDVQQAINLEIFSRFTEEGIEFAYPTQTLFIEKDIDEK